LAFAVAWAFLSSFQACCVTCYIKFPDRFPALEGAGFSEDVYPPPVTVVKDPIPPTFPFPFNRPPLFFPLRSQFDGKYPSLVNSPFFPRKKIYTCPSRRPRYSVCKSPSPLSLSVCRCSFRCGLNSPVPFLALSSPVPHPTHPPLF